MTRVRIPLILRMVKGVVVDIRSDREDTPSTFQVFCSSFKGCLFLSLHSRWPSLWWRAVQVPLQLANVTGHSFIVTWL